MDMSGLRHKHPLYDLTISNHGFGLPRSCFIDLPAAIPQASTPFTPLTPLVQTPSPNSSASISPTAAAVDPSEDSEINSDIVLNYISQMLMEEDIDEKFEQPALLAAEKPFLEILGENFPASRPNNQSSESPDGSFVNSYGYLSGSNGSSVVVDGSTWPYDPIEYSQLQIHPLSLYSNSSGNLSEGLDESLFSSIQNQHALQFRKGVEEASKFLPGKEKLVIDLDACGFAGAEGRFFEVKAVAEECPVHRGRKHFNTDDLDSEEGRSNKQSAVYTEESVRAMFDNVLLCNGETCSKGVRELQEALQHKAMLHSQSSHSKGSSNGKGRGKRQSKKEVVDLRTLLIHCAQAVATDDRRSATELLKQIRQHSSVDGDANQRLAHCFANGIDARLAGTGSQIYHSQVAARTSVTDILKAYQLYMAACPFKKISHYFSNQTILDAAEKAKRVHIIDFGVYYGFQWPCLIQRLSTRHSHGGAPQLRITGIDLPQPGFRPAERIEETGRRLADYARTFNVPFQYHAIAARWETIRIEDLDIDKDELLIVNCLYRFKSLMDETVLVDNPRDMVLNTIRKLNPHVFIHGIVNGSYNAPFFVTRFREALFHFSSLFDMLETNVPKDDEQRLLIERELFGREALNVISCEGLERVERPETYKQWQVRNLRAGFKQLPLNPDIIKKVRDTFKSCYHDDFVVDEDNRWLLQGWKGRIVYALSTWKPSNAS